GAPDRTREAEREDERDDAEERALEHPERLAQALVVLAEVATGRVTGDRCSADDREHDQRHRPAREGEEHQSGTTRPPTNRMTTLIAATQAGTTRMIAP